MFIDVHTHQDVEDCFCLINIDHRDNPNLKITSKYFSYGFHPWNFDNLVSDTSQVIQGLIQTAAEDSCLAIGEIGLDKTRNTTYEAQLSFLESLFIELGKSNSQTPLIFHCVRAYQDLLFLLKKYQIKNPLILHDYNGSKEITKSFQAFNSYFSLGRQLFNANNKLNKSLHTLPIERILFESDEAEDFGIQDVYQTYLEQTGDKLSLLELREVIKDNFILFLGPSVNKIELICL